MGRWSVHRSLQQLPLLVATLGCLGVASSVQAIQTADGTIYFAQPPSLVDASTTFDATRSGATYFFTLSLPKNAGVPLHQVSLTQQSGGEAIQYNLSASTAFEGTRHREGKKLSLGDVRLDRATKTVVVTFDPPVSAGTTFTISLRPRQNPGVPGFYLLGVTAFPEGEKPYGQFLGYARLRFKHRL